MKVVPAAAVLVTVSRPWWPSTMLLAMASPIGKGTHERFIIQNDKFLAKAQGKKKGN